MVVENGTFFRFLPPLAVEPSPSPPSPNHILAPSFGACVCAFPLSPIAIAPVPSSLSPNSILAPPQSGCFNASASSTIPLLPQLTEADLAIFPKLQHEELKKTVRRYGAGIASVEAKAEFVDIGDEDYPSGMELSVVEEYLPKEEVEDEH